MSAWWQPNGWTDDDTGNWREPSGAASSAEQRGDAQQHQRRLEELGDKIQALERTIVWLEDQVRYLSGTRTNEKPSNTDGCNQDMRIAGLCPAI